jgi:hypothetical protein
MGILAAGFYGNREKKVVQATHFLKFSRKNFPAGLLDAVGGEPFSVLTFQPRVMRNARPLHFRKPNNIC